MPDEKWYVVYGIRKRTNEKYVIDCFTTKQLAEKMCEEWGWSYDDGEHSYWMEIEESGEWKAEEI